MMRGGFFGGVHPAYNKGRASSRKIEEMPLPGRLVVFFAQNLGAPSQPVVKKGDEVKKGQVIAESGGFVSTPVHAPTSGKVDSIGIHPSPVGVDTPAAVIVPDGEDEWLEGCDTERSGDNPSIDIIREIVHDNGVVGMGGATFPTHVKLSPPADKKMDILVINGAECEPYLTADHRLMVEQAGGVLDGASLFAAVIGVDMIIVAIEKNKPDAIEIMSS
jgi:electron transport complex protein RnfC